MRVEGPRGPLYFYRREEMRVRIIYAVIPAGAYAGMPALWLTPGKRNDMGFSELKSTIVTLLTDMNLKFKAVVFDVRNDSFPTEDLGEVTQLLDWTVGNAIAVHYLNGYERPPYVRIGGVVKTFIEDDEWLGFPTNELYWTPGGADAPEPELEGYEGTPKYVVLGKKLGARFGMDFLSKCKKAWGIVNPPRKDVEVVLYD